MKVLMILVDGMRPGSLAYSKMVSIFAEGLENVSIKDITPTIAALLGAEAEPEWEGRVLV